MNDERTSVAVQRYLDELAAPTAGGDAEVAVRDLLSRAAGRLHQLCASLLFRGYPRLARGPLNLESDELLGSVVERLIKALRQVRPTSIRQFFALAGQHARWELNDLARRLDERERAIELTDSAAEKLVGSRDGFPSDRGDSSLTARNARCVLDAIDRLPEAEREAFELVRVQGMTHVEAADVLDVAPKTVQRRLNRCTMLLSESLRELIAPARGSGVRGESDRAPTIDN